MISKIENDGWQKDGGKNIGTEGNRKAQIQEREHYRPNAVRWWSITGDSLPDAGGLPAGNWT
jgi:hypothetical protein